MFREMTMATLKAGSAHTVRISDPTGRAEQFSARQRIEFCSALLQALDRYIEARLATVPRWHGRRRQSIRATPPYLQLHYLDPWSSERDGAPFWMPCYLPDEACPLINAQTVFRDGAASLWECVESAATRAEEMAKFFGYHPDGENRLRDFFNACMECDTQPESTPRLSLVSKRRPPPKP